MSVMVQRNNLLLLSLPGQELVSVELWAPARPGATSHRAPWDSMTPFCTRDNQASETLNIIANKLDSAP